VHGGSDLESQDSLILGTKHTIPALKQLKYNEKKMKRDKERKLMIS